LVYLAGHASRQSLPLHIVLVLLVCTTVETTVSVTLELEVVVAALH
jgi:hypothetical protein